LTFSDAEICTSLTNGELSIRPFDNSQINPASYDLRLHKRILVENMLGVPKIDLANLDPNYMMPGMDMNQKDGFVILPGEFILASTLEWVSLSNRVIGRVEGKSSIARAGLMIHFAGFIDPGFIGNITLELVNHSSRSIQIYPGMRIAQISFAPVIGSVSKDYSQTGKYQCQSGPTPSRFVLE
jgi:dCTP deaminase